MLQTIEFASKYVTLDPNTKQSLKRPHRTAADVVTSLWAYRKRHQGQVWASIKDATIPLGWMLSGDVQKEISGQVEKLPHVEALKAIMGRQDVAAIGSTRNAAD